MKFIINIQKIYRIPIYEFCILVFVLPDIAALTSYWLIITTTLERCIAVLYPLEVKLLITRKRCYIWIFILILSFILISSTQIISLKPLPQTPYFCGIRGTATQGYYYYYRSGYPYIKAILMSWIPSILGIVLNIIIVVSLTRATKEMKNIRINQISSIDNLNEHLSNTPKFIDEKLKNNEENNSRKKSFKFFKIFHEKIIPKMSQERQITIMLSTISITFVLLTAPYSIYEILRKMNPNSTKFKNRITQRVIIFFLDCLHATNFILYCLTGKKFRQELKIILYSILKLNS